MAWFLRRHRNGTAAAKALAESELALQEARQAHQDTLRMWAPVLSLGQYFRDERRINHFAEDAEKIFRGR